MEEKAAFKCLNSLQKQLKYFLFQLKLSLRIIISSVKWSHIGQIPNFQKINLGQVFLFFFKKLI